MLEDPNPIRSMEGAHRIEQAQKYYQQAVGMYYIQCRTDPYVSINSMGTRLATGWITHTRPQSSSEIKRDRPAGTHGGSFWPCRIRR